MPRPDDVLARNVGIGILLFIAMIILSIVLSSVVNKAVHSVGYHWQKGTTEAQQEQEAEK